MHNDAKSEFSVDSPIMSELQLTQSELMTNTCQLTNLNFNKHNQTGSFGTHRGRRRVSNLDRVMDSSRCAILAQEFPIALLRIYSMGSAVFPPIHDQQGSHKANTIPLLQAFSLGFMA